MSDSNPNHSNSAPDLTESLEEVKAGGNEQFLAKKISKYDVLKVRVWLEDHFFIFSRFLISRILTLNKVAPKDSIRIAMDLKKFLVEEEKFEVKQTEMEHCLFQIMRGYNYGDAFIHRYRVISNFYAQRAPLLIVVAGPPVCGKSTLVTQLADRVNVANVLQTAIVTNVMKRLSAEYSGKPFWGYPSDEQEEHYRLESRLTRRGVHTDIIKCLQEGKALIIEGYQLDPTLYLDRTQDAPRKFRVMMRESEDPIEQAMKKQYDAIEQANAVIVPFLLTISEKDHAYIIENWLMSVLPPDIQEDVEKIGNFQQQLKHLLQSFQDIQRYLMEYDEIFTVINLNIQHIDETLRTLHDVITARIEASFMDNSDS